MGVSTRSVDRAIRSGRLRAYKVGAAVRIPAEAIAAYRRAHEMRPKMTLIRERYREEITAKGGIKHISGWK